MKRGLTLICALLAMLMAVPALAQATGVAVDGKVYVFSGDKGTYEEDGKTFIIGEDEVIVQMKDGEELRLTLHETVEDDVIEAMPGSQSVTVFSVDDYYGVCIGTGSVEVTIADAIECVSEVNVDAVEFSTYAKYGLNWAEGENKLYYQGTAVRAFEDIWPIEPNASASLHWLDEEGKVDVQAIRDEAGELTGLRQLTDAEFAEHDLSPWVEVTISQATYVTSDGKEWTPEETAAFYAPFAKYGLSYDVESDALSYHGQPVRKFVDVQKSNGESMTGGKFEGELTQNIYEGGVVDVTVVRDHSQPDANGAGKLIGLTVTEVE